MSHPNNAEQQEVFDFIANELDNIDPDQPNYIEPRIAEKI
jgi:hypothetical protein